MSQRAAAEAAEAQVEALEAQLAEVQPSLADRADTLLSAPSPRRKKL